MAQKRRDELNLEPDNGEYSGRGSVYDRQFFTDEELQAADRAREAADAGKTSWSDAHNYVEDIRRKYGYSGGDDGSGYTKLPNTSTPFSYETAPQYASKYQDSINELMQEIMGRGKFEYDPESDPLYQNYKDQYTRNGQLAMQDTLGQISARTGGLASSYAGQAAQQTYNGYMSQLADRIPELYELAYEMYMGEDSRLRNNLSLLQGMEDSDYDRYLTALGQYNNDRNFAYGQYADNRAYDYQAGRDALADSRYEDETAYSRQQDEYSRQLAEAQLRASLGDYSGYAALYGEDTARDMQTRYDALQQLAARGSSSGGSGGGRSSSSSAASGGDETVLQGRDPYDALMEDAEASGHPQSYIANNYKKYGFTSATGLYNEYKDAAEKAKSGQSESSSLRDQLYNAVHLNQNGEEVIDLPGYGDVTIDRLIEMVETGKVREETYNGKYRYTFIR